MFNTYLASQSVYTWVNAFHEPRHSLPECATVLATWSHLPLSGSLRDAVVPLWRKDLWRWLHYWNLPLHFNTLSSLEIFILKNGDNSREWENRNQQLLISDSVWDHLWKFHTINWSLRSPAHPDGATGELSWIPHHRCVVRTEMQAAGQTSVTRASGLPTPKKSFLWRTKNSQTLDLKYDSHVKFKTDIKSKTITEYYRQRPLLGAPALLLLFVQHSESGWLLQAVYYYLDPPQPVRTGMPIERLCAKGAPGEGLGSQCSWDLSPNLPEPGVPIHHSRPHQRVQRRGGWEEECSRSGLQRVPKSHIHSADTGQSQQGLSHHHTFGSIWNLHKHTSVEVGTKYDVTQKENGDDLNADCHEDG